MRELAINNNVLHQEQLDKTGFWGKKGAGCIFLAKDTTKIGIALRSRFVQEPNTWGTVGGAIDPDENVVTAIKREAKEELGYNGELKLLPLYTFKHYSGFVYENYLAVVPREFVAKLDWENQDFGWFDFNHLPDENKWHKGLKTLLTNHSALAKLKREIQKWQK